ncbi:MAG: nucleotidyltransferase domain-containing protein [Chloroflexi bacterium AL-W]|nr:nucleotidyltransferase domain-containing protein [Chloroflexi bacterium AL-N1]NOK67043.1 nucleotidyltransferase domain-containing protein [Chloroflexi bacterium AL-N10]NOK74665.1 nucleotidyltransferase domain-containing protein [Chloroflexi bacterium AL-N5]NOK81645.1 nucleotidyltransferase domain-containing protein [Chloroflexi bacterium AL-W]NOK89115.1 nucleotidyltransferase domain-containing protein [Chloroflexi bacterium AL-N15]
MQQQLLRVLLGLNRVYYFGFKWLDVVAERLQYKPDNLTQRFAQVFQGDPATGAQELSTLVDETYDLIEYHVPQIDVARLRTIFQYQRPVWDEAPPIPNAKGLL